MTYNQEIHHRRSIRLPGYDYAAAGAYFVTISTQDRACLFGELVAGEMRLNGLGRIVQAEWLRSETIRREIALDEFVVMPNHIHGIVIISPSDPPCRGARPCAPTRATSARALLRRAPRSLGSFIAGFKSVVTKRINEVRSTPGVPVWQRNYHDHIIRNDDDLNRIREYILLNPSWWADDRENPDAAIIAGRAAWPFEA
jgi:putative transposase